MNDADNRLNNFMDFYNRNENCPNARNQNENDIHNANTSLEIREINNKDAEINGNFEILKEICDMYVLTKKYN